LAVKDLTSLGQLLANPAIIKDLHGSDYDIRCFDRDYQFRISSLFDTQIAARFLGSTTPNLASVLENFLGVTIPKSHQLQRSDWAQRPLTAGAIDYAASDVVHLVQLSELLRLRLARLGRLEWVAEECRRMEQVRFRTPDLPEVAFLQVKGSDRLDPRELAVLRELFLWRQGKAKQMGYPLYRVLTNEDMLRAAQEATRYPMSGRELEQQVAGCVLALRAHLVDGSGGEVMTAMQRGIQGPLVHRPEVPHRSNAWTPQSKDRLQRLKQRRTGLAANLRIDPALVWPAPSLERVALNPESWRAEFLDDGNKEVRAWQRQEFSQHLMELLGVRD
jgi:ribonuclease D